MEPIIPKQLSEEQKGLYRKKLLVVLHEFEKFCEKYGLRYIGAYGTALGAVRHRGLIPWDDDIDVFMPRDDYEKFLRLKEQAISIGYEILDPSVEGYYLDFAKFCDRNTTIWEVEQYPFVIGVFVDIFPVDNTADSIEKTFFLKKEVEKRWEQYHDLLINFSLSNLIKSLLARKRTDFKIELRRLFFGKAIQKRRTKYLAYQQVLSSQKGEQYIYYNTRAPQKSAIMKKEWIDEVAKVDFEDGYMYIPKDFDGYLRHVYGDYMTFPPVEKQVSMHYHYFVDLNHRLSIPEIKKIIKNAE